MKSKTSFKWGHVFYRTILLLASIIQGACAMQVMQTEEIGMGFLFLLASFVCAFWYTGEGMDEKEEEK